MRKLISIAIALTAIVGLAGCVANTQMTSFKDPSVGHKSYNSVAVIVAANSLPQRAELEGYVVERLTARNVRAVRSVDIWPPMAQQKGLTLDDAVHASGVQALLAFQALGEGVSNSYIPPTVIQPGSVSSQTYGTANQMGAFTNYSGTTTYNVTPPVVAGGFNVSKPTGRYGALLIDAQTAEIVWTAEGMSYGNAFASFDDLHRSMGNETIDRLFNEKLLRPVIHKDRSLDTNRSSDDT